MHSDEKFQKNPYLLCREIVTCLYILKVKEEKTIKQRNDTHPYALVITFINPLQQYMITSVYITCLCIMYEHASFFIYQGCDNGQNHLIDLPTPAASSALGTLAPSYRQRQHQWRLSILHRLLRRPACPRESCSRDSAPTF